MKHKKSIALMSINLGCALGLSSALISCTSEAPPAMLKEQVKTEQLSYAPYVLEKTGRVETVKTSVLLNAEQAREFTLSSTQLQRDDKPQQRIVVEQNNNARVVSGSVLFDSLFALTIDDMRQASVGAIRDSAYNGGNAIPCACFETGEKWNYVWTRDLSYAADLSLAYFDPQRVKNSMLFKTSAARAGVTMPAALPQDSLQIIQDTGSGGSWPVSTDRVTWAIAAETLINSLYGVERAAFIDTAYRALRGTVEADRMAAFDVQQGLYGGEQSYLDWRTQTYAPWIVNNLARMAESKALSTNVAHFQALSLAARLAAEKNDLANAQKYSAWAQDLKLNINKKFWLEDKGLFASLTTAAEDQAPVYKFDMLGNALAIIHGVATPEQAQAVMKNYPHAPYGVPVYYPQQPEQHVYHNRALWPFVTAYSLRAAAAVKNYRAADNAISSLVRATSLNLSNMENLEWLTAKPWYDDGPTINSRRQLWSVGAYLNMVSETYFGFHLRRDGFAIEPFLTSNGRNLLGDTHKARLENFSYQGKTLAIELNLPARTQQQGYYQARKIVLNGKPVAGVISAEMLAQGENIIEVSFGKLLSNDQTITLIPEVDPLSRTVPSVFSPPAPEALAVTIEQGKFALSFTHNSSAGAAVYNLYRNGELIAANLNTLQWRAAEPAQTDVRQCFAVEAVYLASGNKSHHSEPVCYDQQARQIISVTDKRVSSNIAVTAADAQYSKATLREWGKPGDTLRVNNIAVAQAGTYALQVIYNNRQHDISTGVTNSLKRVVISSAAGKVIAEGVVQMPNVEDRNGQYPLRASTEIKLRLEAGEYQLTLDDFFNMSYLASNQTYVGSGGLAGPVNTASIAEFTLTRIAN